MQHYLRQFLRMSDVFGIFERDPFGNPVLVKRMLIAALGTLTYPRFVWYNRVKIEGSEHLHKLPPTGVLFLSNHQTYFADVICLYHIFCSIKWGFTNTIKIPIYLFAPRVHNYYVAASETMKEGGIIPKLFAQAGAITVQRSWRAKGQDVNREVDSSANDKVGKGLGDGWVISFPQGTTSPYAPLRKGTAHIIKAHNPIVVPVVIDGFRRAFDKKGLFFRKKYTTLKITFKEPMRFDGNATNEEILDIVRRLIEQEIPHRFKK
jgi:1-acyl-sn-glycerol-3-phosphate acyltransferase